MTPNVDDTELTELKRQLREEMELIKRDRDEMRQQNKEMEKRLLYAEELCKKYKDERDEFIERLKEERQRKIETKPSTEDDKKKQKKYITGGFMKEIPQIEPFDLKSQRSWDRFIGDFEEICEHKFPSGEMRHLWTAELRRNLTGELKALFENYGGSEKNYDDMKKELGTWVANTRKLKTFDDRKFLTAKRGMNEDIAMYAVRLQTMFSQDFPGADENSEVMMSKLVDTLPTNVAVSLKQQMTNTRNFMGREMVWDEVMQYLMQLRDSHMMMSTQKPLYSDVAKCNFAQMPQGPMMPQIHSSNGVQNGNIVQCRPCVGTGKCRPCQGTGLFDKSTYQRATANPVNYGQGPPRQEAGNCRYCFRKGHNASDCRKRLGLCFRCGGRDHFSRECRQPAPPGRSNNQGYNYRQRQENTFCFVCGSKNHVARNCENRQTKPSTDNQEN